ncbi:hypothetical protein ACWCXB_35295 [Streptomyces sp. NPDC001514]
MTERLRPSALGVRPPPGQPDRDRHAQYLALHTPGVAVGAGQSALLPRVVAAVFLRPHRRQHHDPPGPPVEQTSQGGNGEALGAQIVLEVVQPQHRPAPAPGHSKGLGEGGARHRPDERVPREAGAGDLVGEPGLAGRRLPDDQYERGMRKCLAQLRLEVPLDVRRRAAPLRRRVGLGGVYSGELRTVHVLDAGDPPGTTSQQLSAVLRIALRA